MQKPADAERYRVEREADAKRYEREQASVAELAEERNRADAVKAAGEAEADTIRAKGQAEAESVEAAGLAEAKATSANADAYAKYNEAAKLALVLEVMPKIAEEIARPYSSIDSISIVSPDGESKLSQNVTSGMKSVMDSMRSTMGVDVEGFLQTLTAGGESADETD